jgi:HSP20 family protein
MANLMRRRDAEPGRAERSHPFRTVRDLLRWDPFGRDVFQWDPFAEIEPSGWRTEAAFIPAVEVKETEDAYRFKVDLPGMKEEDVEVSITGNRVTISGEREEEERQEGDRYHVCEFSYGTFSRSFTLPEGVDLDKAKAEFKDGVLMLAVPKREASQARRITIGAKGEEEKREQAPADKQKEEAGQRKAA